jgi:hypothetical protein
MEGWITIHRKIKEHWIWDDATYLKAWIAILLTVNHENNKVLIEGELIECKRGQSLLSLNGWAKCFGKRWTIQRVRTFLKLLKDDAMIEVEGLRKTTRVTVCNYDTYQINQQTNNRQITRSQQGDNKEITTNNNEEQGIKNEKKKKYAEFVSMLEIDYNKLISEHGIENTTTFINSLNVYKGSTGKRYKSDYMTILNWVIDKAKKEGKYIRQAEKQMMV